MRKCILFCACSFAQFSLTRFWCFNTEWSCQLSSGLCCSCFQFNQQPDNWSHVFSFQTIIPANFPWFDSWTGSSTSLTGWVLSQPLTEPCLPHNCVYFLLFKYIQVLSASWFYLNRGVTGIPCSAPVSSSSPSSSLWLLSASATAWWSSAYAASASCPAPRKRTATCGASPGWFWWWWQPSWCVGRPSRSWSWLSRWVSTWAACSHWSWCTSASRWATSTAAWIRCSTLSWMRTSSAASASSASRHRSASTPSSPAGWGALPGRWQPPTAARLEMVGGLVEGHRILHD